MTLDLHLGAHKTATTFLQNTLSQHKKMLAQNGINFLSPREFRHFHEENWADGSPQGIKKLQDQCPECASWALDPSRNLLISDENLLGPANPFYSTNTFYPHISRYLSMLSEMLPCAPARVFLSIRAYARVYPALYYQFQKRETFLPIDDVLQDRLVVKQRRWCEVAQDIQTVFPNSKIMVWQYEDLQGNEEKIFEVMLGKNLGLKFDRTNRPRSTAGSESYAHWVKALSEGGEYSDKFSRFVQQSGFIESKNSKPLHEVFWREADILALNRAYTDDIKWFMDEGLLIDFGQKC